ncbi:efflux transporter outer membrane subunit [Caulobacter sp. KR2-114]|uniref:efflux transporter outer membrane subunit n=1 Tax=Caulobacter sp. KR2-114 TaxID=3400912 RepID=UPI003C064E66
MSPSRLVSALAAAALVALLAGCATVGPDYAAPKAAKANLPTATGPFVGAAEAPVAQAPLPDDWWTLYDDPALNDLVRQALVANTDLRVAAANLARARAVQTEADDEGSPKFAAHGAAERTVVSGESYLLTEPVPAMTVGDVGLNVAYEIDLVGRLRRLSEAARADTEASRAALDLARVSVAADVTRAYIDACSAGHELAVADQSVALQQKSLEVTRRLVAAGRGNAIDLTRAQALLETSRAAAPTFEARRRAAVYRLAVLTGRPPAEYSRTLDACEAAPKLAQDIPVGDGAALIARRPDVRQAERGLAGATARIGIATAALYPTVTLGAGLGSSGLLSDLGQPAANHWNFGSLISWSLPDAGTHARIRAADANADAALARFDGAVLGALRETETSLTMYGHDLQRNAALRAARDQARLADQQADTLYRAGRAPYLTGLDARRTLTQAEAALAASDSQVADDQVALFLALGGGWKDAPPVQTVKATEAKAKGR